MVIAAALIVAGCGQKTEIVRLRTDYQETPIGIETQAPRLSWQMSAERYGAAQQSYRIVSATEVPSSNS